MPNKHVRFLMLLMKGRPKFAQKLQFIITNFEALTMYEDESIAEFNVHIRDLANESFFFLELP